MAPGKATGDVLVKEIMMLTNMNWNSGDSLYKHLPVTLDFAKVLLKMSKQNEALYDKLYDFRKINQLRGSYRKFFATSNC